MGIKPSTLKHLRENLSWSQADLEKKSKVSKRQIQRLEGEETGAAQKQIRATTINRLAKALGVSPSQLTGDLPLSESPTRCSHGLEAALAQRLDPRTVLNFDLLTAKYGVTMEEVILAAPALFSMFAVRAERQYEKILIELLNEGDQDVDAGDLSPPPWEDHDDTDSAASVIRHAKIFWVNDQRNDWHIGQNAFVEALQQELFDTDHPPAQLIDISGGFGHLAMHPGYRIPQTNVLRNELDRLTCLDPEARDTLFLGGARLHEIPQELLKANRAIERVNWLRQRSPKPKADDGDDK